MKSKIIVASGIGGALPDIDAFSLWSHFDKIVGKPLGLLHSGKEIYASKFWYSHHAFFHSILAGIIIALCIGLFLYLFQLPKSGHSLKNVFSKHSLLLIGIFCGFVIHLFEDMPTPASVWSGIDFFWPSHKYLGGTGAIWWWNNYDIFLIVSLSVIINLGLLLLKRFVNFKVRKLLISVFLIATLSCCFQIKSRPFHFNYVGQTSNFQLYEQKSKDIQRKILGSRIYGGMDRFDSWIRINF